MLDSMYQEVILDHYKNPQYKGLREGHQACLLYTSPSPRDS